MAAAILNFGKYAFSTWHFFGQIHNIPTKFGEEWLNSKEIVAVLEFKDGGGRHLEKYISGLTTNVIKEFPVFTSNQKSNVCGVILTF